MNEKVIDMIENHHGEQFSISLEAAIVQVADAISSVRPGARREVIEDYMKRVQEMVDSGVTKVALACPFCMVMVQDGLNKVGKEKQIQVVDLAELVQQSM